MNPAIHDITSLGRTLHRPPVAGSAGLAASIARVAERWRARIKDRRAFAALDYRDLRDLGLSRWEVESEMLKPFWRE
jgi:uncharacterized protein YjiS (DUF1127 family)